jgi:hypothetical protein
VTTKALAFGTTEDTAQPLLRSYGGEVSAFLRRLRALEAASVRLKLVLFTRYAKEPMDPFIKYRLGFRPDTPDMVVKREWLRRTKNVCKPCWELKYCPYGPLVEQFPPRIPTRQEAIQHNQFLKEQLAKKAYKDWRKKTFEKQVREFNSDNYPKKRSELEEERTCMMFGHLCPVFFVNEPFTETQQPRRISRNIPRGIMMRVARRDHNTCQLCGRLLRDDEIEFDHIIPLSKGGSTEESNLRVACRDCNRGKGNEVGLELRK